MKIIINEDAIDVDDPALDLDGFKVARESEDAFDRWKREEFVEENLTSEGVYLGDGIYHR